ncbi:MAG: cytochrome c biogenesis protein CcdA [Firmicutes bacterium]|nr:cytochrome c biogenesis protein CcdA [Bacillota bacterium]
MSIPAAFLAGIIAFLSPCVLPLLPVYLAFLGGGGNQSRKQLAINILFFTLGFSLVFTALGAGATAVGRLLFDIQPILIRVAGIVLVIFGLQMLGFLQFKALSHHLGINIRPARSKIGYFLFGVTLALGWTPCIGIMLASILMLAGSQETVYQGMLLLFVFSLGFAVPFYAIGLVFGTDGFGVKSRRAAFWIQRIAGVVLLIMGVLLFFNLWQVIQGLFI